MKYASILIFILTLNISNLFGQNLKNISISRMQDVQIKIDGLINEDAWNTATIISDFVQREPIEGDAVSESTIVYLMFDQENLYIAFRCWDKEPDKIVANVMRRDEWLLNNDCIEIYLDTYHDHRNAFCFSTNPLGAQRDGIITAELLDEQQNWDWNAVWNNTSRITNDGWTAEIVIPFKTLRFKENEDSVWGINFARYIPRKREEAFWSPILREYGWAGKYRVAAFGHLTGLQNIQHPEKIEFKPFILVGLKRNSEEDDAYDTDKNIGFDAKYLLTPNLTLDLSLNTDFAQVEADQEQVNLTRFELFFPEKREFFLEGANIFRFGERAFSPIVSASTLFFSRRIGLSDDNELIPLIGGVKITGKMGNLNTGFINVLTEGKDYINSDDEAVSVPMTNSTVFRMQQDIFNRSSIGLIGLNKESLDNMDYNRNIGLDANFFLSENTQVGGFLAKSFSPDDNGKNLAGYADFHYNDDLWIIFASQNSIQNNFNPDMGFFPRTGIRKTQFNLNISPRPDIFNIRQIFIFNDFHYITDQQGNLESRLNFTGIFSLFQNRSYAFAMLSQNHENLTEEFEIHDDIIIPAGIYRFTNFYGEYETDKSKAISGTVSYNAGQFFNGTISGYGMKANFKIGAHLAMNFEYQYNDVRLPAGNFKTTLLSTRIIYSFSPKLFIKPYVQWNSDANVLITNILFNFIHSPGSDLYIVYNEELDKSGDRFSSKNRALLMKFTYLFSI